MSNSLQGKTAIITGGSTELAGAVAVALADHGVNICLCGKQADLLEMSTSKLKENGGKVVALISELDTLEKTESVVKQTVPHLGSVDECVDFRRKSSTATAEMIDLDPPFPPDAS